MLSKAERNKAYSLLDAAPLSASRKRGIVRMISDRSITFSMIVDAISGDGKFDDSKRHNRDQESGGNTGSNPGRDYLEDYVRNNPGSGYYDDDGNLYITNPPTANIGQPGFTPDTPSIPDKGDRDTEPGPGDIVDEDGNWLDDSVPFPDLITPDDNPLNDDHHGNNQGGSITGDDDGFGLFDGLFPNFGKLIQSLISKWTDATVTGGEEIRNQWDLDKINLSNEFSAQQAEISRDWQEEMYNKYNSLSGKIAQAEQVGVNPLFAVSGGVSPTGFSSASPSGSVASGSGSPSGNNLSGMLSAIGSLLKIKSEIKAIDAKASKDVAEAKTIEAARDLTLQQMSADILNTGSSTQLNLQKVVESFTSIEKLKADMNLSNAQAGAVASQVAWLEAQTNYLNLTGPYDVRIKAANALLAEWQEKNKTLFKGVDIGMDVVNTIADIGLGIVQAKTGLKLAENVSNR